MSACMLVPADVPHPLWCDPRRCHVRRLDEGAEGMTPLLVHEGEFQKLAYRSIVLFQCQTLSADESQVTGTHSPMVKVEGAPIGDAGFAPDRARIWGELLHDAGVAAERGGLPYVDEFVRIGGVW